MRQWLNTAGFAMLLLLYNRFQGQKSHPESVCVCVCVRVLTGMHIKLPVCGLPAVWAVVADTRGALPPHPPNGRRIAQPGLRTGKYTSPSGPSRGFCPREHPHCLHMQHGWLACLSSPAHKFHLKLWVLSLFFFISSFHPHVCSSSLFYSHSQTHTS